MNNNSRKIAPKSSKSTVSKNSKAPSTQRGYRPSGPSTSTGCTPPNVGTGINKHK